MTASLYTVGSERTCHILVQFMWRKLFLYILFQPWYLNTSVKRHSLLGGEQPGQLLCHYPKCHEMYSSWHGCHAIQETSNIKTKKVGPHLCTDHYILIPFFEYHIIFQTLKIDHLSLLITPNFLNGPTI